MNNEVRFALAQMDNQMRHERRQQMLRETHIVKMLSDQIRVLMEAVPNYDKEKLESLMEENTKLYNEARAVNDKGYEDIVDNLKKAYDELCKNVEQKEKDDDKLLAECLES